MNRFLGWRLFKDIREFACCPEFLPVFAGYIVEKNGEVFLPVVVIKNGDTPKSELLSINSTERVRILDLDEVLEFINSVARGNLDRERVGRSLSINKTEQGQTIVGHGVAKHEMKRKMEEGWRM